MSRAAIDTSTTFGTVAVARGDRVLAEVGVGLQARHSETILPALETALAMAGLERRDIEGIVGGAGPGSFTGVRVAAATAKGLAAALEVPLHAWSSLLPVAVGVASDRPVCTLFDARRGEVYAGCWRVAAEEVETVLEPTVAPVDEIVGATRSADPLFAGDGALRYREHLGDAPVIRAPAPPRASALLWLADRHPDQGRVSDASEWEPVYVRASSAERGVKG